MPITASRRMITHIASSTQCSRETSGHEQRGDLPFGSSPPALPCFRRPGSASRPGRVYRDSQTESASCGTFELSSSFPHFPDIASVTRVSSQPFVSFVADSLEGHWSTLSFFGEDFSSVTALESRSKTGVVAMGPLYNQMSAPCAVQFYSVRNFRVRRMRASC